MALIAVLCQVTNSVKYTYSKRKGKEVLHIFIINTLTTGLEREKTMW